MDTMNGEGALDAWSDPSPAQTDEFYRESCERGFVKTEAIARNLAWTTQTAWGELEITVNLSKPEKDPRAIAAASRAAADGPAGYVDPATGFARPCPLCVTEQDLACGYARRIRLGGEPWAMWYSPYAYYEQHCIAMSWTHRPMHVDRAAFCSLFDAVDLFPWYFFGSNADLPIVGGSILAHDHFQGGAHVFPMQRASLDEVFAIPGFDEVKAGFVRWPVSVVRLCSPDRAQLVDAACRVLDAWRGYDDERVGIVSGAGTQIRHNTITPILRADAGGYQLDLALRCNITSENRPLGVFHPSPDLHHIKRENIGLIEVMGLAILPPRVLGVMEELSLSRDEVGRLFGRVLECAGVFKWDEEGLSARSRFLEALVQ